MNLIGLFILAVLLFVLYVAARNVLLVGQVRKLLAAGARVIDVRSEQEFRAGHFSTAVNIPAEQIEQRLFEVNGDRKAPVILYCYGGSRSAMASGILRKNGFSNVINARSYTFMQRFDKNK
jgi:rhodanese-related sulfurtransferase